MRREAGVAHPEHEVPVAVAPERRVERPKDVVQLSRVGKAAREDGVVHAHPGDTAVASWSKTSRTPSSWTIQPARK